MSAASQPTPEQVNAMHERAFRGRAIAATLGYSSASPNRALLSGRATAPKLPSETFAGYAGHLYKLAREVSAPLDYVAGSLLASAAAMIGNGGSVMPDPQLANWVEPSGLWVNLVGNPSSGKSPPMKLFTAILEEMEAKDVVDFRPKAAENEKKCLAAKDALDKWHSECAQARKEGFPQPDKPQEALMPPRALAPRTITTDATIEALCEMLSNSPNGMLMYRDELAGWVGDMTRYSKSSDRPKWLTLFSGGILKIDRVKNSGEPIIVKDALMSVLGAMQPDKLKEVLASSDDGLVARQLYFWPDPVPVVRSEGRTDMSVFKVAFNKLRMFKNPRVPLAFTSDAADLFFEFRQYTNSLDAETSGPLLGWVGKGNGVVARLAAILTILDWAFSDSQSPPPFVVERDAVLRAGQLWAEYLYPMARRAFGDALRSDIERNAAALLKEARKRGDAMVNARVIYSEWKLAGLREPKPVREALAYLCDAGWVEPTDTVTGGRPKGNWSVNPLLWESV